MNNQKQEFLYAVVKDGLIENVVVGDIDESGPILAAMFPGTNVILVTEETGQAIIGGDFVDGVFRAPKPYNSWVWDSDLKQWTAPVSRPSGPHYWNEEYVSWLPIPAE